MEKIIDRMNKYLSESYEKIVIINNDAGDWMGLYYNGKLVLQDHKLNPEDVLKALNIKHSYIYDYDMGRDSSYPKSLKDLNI